MAKKLYIGVDLGGTSMRAAAVDRDGNFGALSKRKTHPELGVKGVFERLVRTIEDAADEANVPLKEIGGIGVGVPGPVDTENGVVRLAVNLGADWANMPLAAQIKKATGVPAYIDNDVRVGAVGEFEHGAGKDVQDMVAVFVGTGIGGGIILDGKLRGGFRGGAGEVGHTVVADGNGIIGKTGQPGTVEPLASRTGMERAVREAVASGKQSVVPELIDSVGGGRLTSSVIYEALQQKDEVMAQANIVNTLDPAMVVFGGGVTERLGDGFVAPIRTTAYANFINKDTADKVHIVPAGLKDASGVVGASVLARRRL
jgi:glucokinase